MNPFNYLIPIALGVVFLTLCFGIYTLFRGGDFGRSWSNKAMRFRVVAQFIAILVLVAAMWIKAQSGAPH
ncbi:MAG: twin transmembrane helix small protein [Hyphomonadaceae bacterium]|nr:twin transmembrane helix small protein [Hyphomonadaceae bacterium]